MSRLDVEIKDIFDIPRWEVLQSSIAKIFDVSVTIIDYRGNPVTQFSNCSEFCRLVRSSSSTRKHCCKCSLIGALEAVRSGKPYIYSCSLGIMHGVIPIMLDERFLGAVLVGQVMPKFSAEKMSPEKLIDEVKRLIPNGKEPDHHTLIESYYAMPEMEYERISEICNFFQIIIRYIVEHSIKAKNEAQTYEWMLRYAVPPMLDAQSPTLTELLPPTSANEAVEEKHSVSMDSPVYPAVSYVESHRRQMIGMREMADLCHLSPSYFSKLFLREVGENFTDWVSRRKIDWAKEMLHDSTKSITTVAVDLGYMDTSYFIKVFKKFEGITPLVYRQRKI